MSDEEYLDINECFADNITKFRKTFWQTFKDWEGDGFKDIYSALPDPDSYSERLYKFHERLWNNQMVKCNLETLPEVGVFWSKTASAWELNRRNDNDSNDKKFRLGSDSFISIYWAWKNMQEIVKDVSSNIAETIEYIQFKKGVEQLDKRTKENRCYDESWKQNNPVKLFIWRYLQISNTIGGFIVFPRYSPNSINIRRGRKNGTIKDRFDLTLECIRRYYVVPKEYNPLFTNIYDADKDFFDMFGDGIEGFKNYIDFFCLQDWVNDKYEVLDLLGDTATTPLDADKTWKDNKIIPYDFDEDEQVKRWWNLYSNLMYRLEKRNKRIEEILNSKK